MTNRATLEALLARVLAGTGPDRELDAEIGAAVRALPSSAVGLGVVGWLRRWEGPFVTDPSLPGYICTENRVNWKAPPYTTSLDAAITLVPTGAAWVRRTPSTMALVFGGDDFRMTEVHTEPCRALIAACLKARMEALGE